MCTRLRIFVTRFRGQKGSYLWAGWQRLPFGKGGAAVAEAEPEDQSSTSEAKSGPPLMVLVERRIGTGIVQDARIR